jgi:hypothetical protein
MSTQPEALRLAKLLLSGPQRPVTNSEAADELRRLHEVNAELVEALRLMNVECQHLHHAKKDQHGYNVDCPVVTRIQMSIAKATGEQQ